MDAIPDNLSLFCRAARLFGDTPEEAPQPAPRPAAPASGGMAEQPRAQPRWVTLRDGSRFYLHGYTLLPGGRGQRKFTAYGVRRFEHVRAADVIGGGE